MRDRGHEFGTTTGRERRCGWLDLVALRYATRLNRLSALAITKLDVLSGLDPLRIAVRYRGSEGAIFNEFPYHQSILHTATPEYEELPGWEDDISDARSESDLPKEAREYLAAISDGTGVPINVIGVGPGRDQVIWTSAASGVSSGIAAAAR
jgi:adenylosuccinate synthase